MSFKLPSWGGAMVHSDPQMSDFINMKIINLYRLLGERVMQQNEK